MAYFLKPKHISIFVQPLWFAYKDFDKVEKVAKWRLLGDKRHAKYDLNNKDHFFATLSNYIILNIYLKNLISLLFV